MVTFTIGYEAQNKYVNEVQEAFFEFLVCPCRNENQQLNWERNSNSANVAPFLSKNVFGYNSLSFRLVGPFHEFNFSYQCEVLKTREGYIPLRNEFVSLADERQVLTSEAFQVDHYLYIKQTNLTEIPLHSIPANMRLHQNMYLLDYIKSLNQYIHQYIKYSPNTTTVQTNAQEIWFKPVGVCQDYTHLMLGILRSQQIPARYVSGYLNQGSHFVGAAQMHAWVEVFVPHYGWIGLDPTNNLWADYQHIKVADGQDYGDCSALKGYIKPVGINTSDHSVQVVEQ